MLHRPLIAAIALLPVLALASQAATSFTDIPPGHWARRAASVLSEHQLMPGRTPVDFAGDSPLSRYELAWTLSHLYNIDGPPPSFTVLADMLPGHMATLEVQRVMGFGLLAPRTPGRFDGDLPASRKEVYLALDTLFAKDGVQPPGRKTAVIFPDVPAGTPLGQAIDRIANRFALIDARQGLRFEANDSLNRYQFLAMLMRAMRYLQPAVARELAEPRPAGSLGPGETPNPDDSPTPPPSPTPTPVASSVVLRSRAWVQGELLAIYAEDLPTDPGLVVAGEQRSYMGNGLPGGGGGLELWSGNWGLTLGLSSYVVGYAFTTPGAKAAGATTTGNVLETMADVQGLYQFVQTPEFQLAGGLAAVVRKNFNLTSASSYYTSADKLYAGGGPALAFGWHLWGPLGLSGGVAALPLIEDYNLPTGTKDIVRFAALPRVRLEYTFAGNWLATLGTSALVSAGGGGDEELWGFSLGIGSEF